MQTSGFSSLEEENCTCLYKLAMQVCNGALRFNLRAWPCSVAKSRKLDGKSSITEKIHTSSKIQNYIHAFCSFNFVHRFIHSHTFR